MSIDIKNKTEHYKHMVKARFFEDKLSSLFRQGLIHGGTFLGTGHEALAAAMGMLLKKGDVLAPLIRDMAARLAFGETIFEASKICLGKADTINKGRDANVHRGDISKGILHMISNLGAMVSVASGCAFANRYKGKKDTIAVASMGEGGFNTGAVSEAMTVASLEKLPLVLVIANNGYAYSTPNDKTIPCDNLLDRGAAFGFEAHEVDATNSDDCLETIEKVFDLARKEQKPQLVIANLKRLCGHGEHDDGSYMPESHKKDGDFDCITIRRKELKDSIDIEAIEKEVKEEIETEVARAMKEKDANRKDDDGAIYSNIEQLYKGGIK